MWLSANYAFAFTAVLGAFGFFGKERWRRTSSAAREAAIVFVLYALWRLFDVVTLRMNGAQRRGLQIWHVERAIGIGSERWLQQRIIDHSLLSQAANGYYAILHVPAMIICLLWLYFRHRDSYAHWRSVLALSTGADVLIRLVPVAPPRLLPDLGFVDIAIKYHQSVYGRFGGGVSDQLAAMPSIHAGWAILVAASTWRCTQSRWRWVAIAHATLTMLSVVVTANHWWLDCIVAGAMLVPISLIWSRAIQLYSGQRSTDWTSDLSEIQL